MSVCLQEKFISWTFVFFHSPYVRESHQLDLLFFFKFERKYYIFVFFYGFYIYLRESTFFLSGETGAGENHRPCAPGRGHGQDRPHLRALHCIGQWRGGERAADHPLRAICRYQPLAGCQCSRFTYLFTYIFSLQVQKQINYLSTRLYTI